MCKFRLILIIFALFTAVFLSGGRADSQSFFSDEQLDKIDEGSEGAKGFDTNGVWDDIKRGIDKAVNEDARNVQKEALQGVEPGKISSGVEPVQRKVLGDEDLFDEDLISEKDTIFMGDDQIEIDLEDESPEYMKAKDILFVEPMLRLGTRPLKLTLEDCIRIALLNNNKIQATDYGVDAARAKYAEASARFYPIFEYEWLNAPVPRNAQHAAKNFFQGNVTWFNKLRLTMGVPVYAFGKLRIAQNLALGGIAAARAERSKERLSTVTRVRQLYYGVLLAEEMGRLLSKAYEKLSREIKKANSGGRSPLEKIKAKVFLVEMERRLGDVRSKELLALEGLRVQLGLSPDVAVMVYSKKLRPIKIDLRPLEDYTEMALKNRPDVKLVEIGLETRRNLHKLEKRNFFPDIGFGAYFDVGRTITPVRGLQATDDFNDPFNFTRAGIGIRMKGRFDIHGQAARAKKARNDYYKASLEHYMAKDGISLQVRETYMRVVKALNDVRRADRAQRFARQLIFLSQSNYELGVGDEEEYVSSLELVLMTRGKYFEAVFNYNVALAILEEKTGIIPDIGIAKKPKPGYVEENVIK